MGNMNEDGKPKITIMGIIIIFALMITGIVQFLYGGQIILKSQSPKHMNMETAVTLHKGEYVSADVMYSSSEFCTYNHSINLVPIGKEHFFLIISDDFSKCYAIRADKSWGDHFDKVVAKSLNGEKLDGYVTGLKYKVQNELKRYLVDINNSGMDVDCDTVIVIDTLAKRYAWFHIAEGLFLAILMAWAFVRGIQIRMGIREPYDAENSTFEWGFKNIALVVLCVVWGIAVIHTISMMV